MYANELRRTWLRLYSLAAQSLTEAFVHLRPNHKIGFPILERYILDLLERSKRVVKRSKQRLAESEKLEKISHELLERLRSR